jgi:hypothetical protein
LKKKEIIKNRMRNAEVQGYLILGIFGILAHLRHFDYAGG